MNVQRTGWQIEKLLDDLRLTYETEIASTGSRYYRLDYCNTENGFTIRVSDHGQVYGNPLFDISDSPDSNTYKDVKLFLIDLAKKEKKYCESV
jgi:hypothetical protein